MYGYRERYKQEIYNGIDYEVLVERYGSEKIDGIVQIMLDAICSEEDYVRIAFDKIPTEVVTDIFLNLKSTHIEYVIECMEKNASHIGNIKNYILRALYNAPSTIEFYYRNEVNKKFGWGKN